MLNITREQFDDFFTGVKTNFQGAFDGVDQTYMKIATVIPSSGKQESYGWLGDMPRIREWIGDRVLNEISSHNYTIVNKTYEGTIRVNVDDIDDGSIAQYGILAKGIGDAAANFPEEQVYTVLVQGFTERCYDGQNFFDTDHPVMVDGEEESVSNMQDGEGEPWFLLDTTKIVNPIIFQDRLKPEFASLDTTDSTMVFMKNEYAFGTKQRSNAGYSFWQIAYGSRAPLTAENLKAARLAMQKFKNDSGQSLKVKPNILVVGSSNEDTAEMLVSAEKIDGEHNTIRNKYEVITSAWIDE
jgi:phage major head subunit gpT-like protein